MTDKVLVVPVTASKCLDELVKKRRANIEELKADLDVLWSEARDIEEHTRTK
jgi:hypothetical protein